MYLVVRKTVCHYGTILGLIRKLRAANLLVKSVALCSSELGCTRVHLTATLISSMRSVICLAKGEGAHQDSHLFPFPSCNIVVFALFRNRNAVFSVFPLFKEGRELNFEL